MQYNTNELSLGLSWPSQLILPKVKKKKSRNGSTLFRGREIIIRGLRLKGLNIRGCFWRMDWDGERMVERRGFSS